MFFSSAMEGSWTIDDTKAGMVLIFFNIIRFCFELNDRVIGFGMWCTGRLEGKVEVHSSLSSISRFPCNWICICVRLWNLYLPGVFRTSCQLYDSEADLLAIVRFWWSFLMINCNRYSYVVVLNFYRILDFDLDCVLNIMEKFERFTFHQWNSSTFQFQ